jgi:hypothetical protein
MILAVGCGPGQDQEAPAEEVSEAEAPTPNVLDAFAGTWSMQALTESGDSVLIAYEMVATSSTEGWTITFPDRDPLPAHIVEAAGDSVVIHVGPYASALREDVQVSTVTVSRIVDGAMMGHFTATYQMEGGEETLTGLQQGERVH